MVCLCAARDFTPSDGHPVLSLSWSPTGDAFLVVMSSAQPRIYDRWVCWACRLQFAMHEGATGHYHFQAYLLQGAGTSTARGDMLMPGRHPAPALLHLRLVVTEACMGGSLHQGSVWLHLQCSTAKSGVQWW